MKQVQAEFFIVYTVQYITEITVVVGGNLFILLRIWGTIRFFMLLRTETLSFKGDITTFETALLYLQVR